MRRGGLRGFTVVELLIVVSIIMILATLLGGVLLVQYDRAKNTAQSSQINKILAALEQFKNDFNEYPSVDAAVGAVSATSPEWAEHNSLAFRLCQGITGIAAPGANVRLRDNWTGSYLTAEDVAQELIRNHSSPTSTTNKTEMLDLWSNPLAYCMATSVFLKGVAERKVPAPAPPTSHSTSWATSSTTTLAGGASPAYSIDGSTFNGRIYSKNGIYYARPSQNTSNNPNGFMGPVSYALNDTWIDAEMNMPEIWSKGKDGLYGKLQYNKNTSSFKVTTDADNVGGNLNVMKVQ